MDLSKYQCNNIKGFAILLILIHNYVDHLLHIDCNEFVFSQKNCDIFIDNFFTKDAFWYIISYAGWIGVPLFFFLSGYGLSKKYGNNAKSIDYGHYIKNHIIKLWKLLIPVYVLCFILTHYVFGRMHNIKSAIAQITFTINFLHFYDNDFILYPGVYWFFGAILQFYLLFLLIRKLSSKWLFVLCVIFILIHYYVLYFIDSDMMYWVRHNFLGWGVPFIFGMIAARKNISIPKHTNYYICAGSFIALCVCLTTKAVAPFVEIFTIILLVIFSNLYTSKWSHFLGIISPSIFVIHPFVRALYFNLFYFPDYPLIMTIIYVIPVIYLSRLHHRLLNKSFFLKRNIKSH